MKPHSTMGTWKTRKNRKQAQGKGSEKSRGRARIYYGGWVGGEPEKNGYKP